MPKRRAGFPQRSLDDGDGAFGLAFGISVEVGAAGRRSRNEHLVADPDGARVAVGVLERIGGSDGLTFEPSGPLQKFDPIAERVIDVAALETLQWLVAPQRVAGLFEAIRGLGQVIDHEGGVRLAGRRENLFDAEVNLHGAALEPTAATLREVDRLCDFGKPKQAGVECPRVVLAPRRHGKLHVIETQDRHRVPSTPVVVMVG